MRRSSLARVFQRIGRGLLGSWCIVGPPALIVAFTDFTLALVIAFLFFVGGFYVIAILKWRSQGMRFIKNTVRDTLLLLLFAAIGGVFGPLLASSGTSTTIAPMLTLVCAVLGFWIVEVVSPGEPKLDQQ